MEAFLSCLLIVGCILGVQGDGQAKNDTKTGNTTLHFIVNGHDAKPHQWPWQISLRKNGRHICGGSIINDKWVITAAHCVYHLPYAFYYTVVVGAHRRLGTTSVQKTFNVKWIKIHEAYVSSTFKNDVALLLLDGRVDISSEVKPIGLPLQGSRATVGKTCYITGWGRLGAFEDLANILQEAPIPISSYLACRMVYGFKVDRQAMICAGGRGKGGCNGDSGGPLACKEGNQWILRGLTSWGRRGCSTSHYTVFARVSSFVSWINTTTAYIEGIVRCPPLTCYNGGTKHCPSFGRAVCNCTFGFTGRQCLTRIVRCPPLTCYNGGTKHCPSFGRAVCNCTSGFTGRQCLTRHCHALTCYNGGTRECLSSGRAVCRCSPDFTGEQCENRSRICRSLVCLNGGTSVCSGDGQSFCNCVDGYNGEWCQFPEYNESSTPPSLKCYHCKKENCIIGEKSCSSRETKCASITHGESTIKSCATQTTCDSHCVSKSNCKIQCCSSDLCNHSSRFVSGNSAPLVIVAALMAVVAETVYL